TIYKLAYALIFKKLQKVFGDNIRFLVGGGALLDISQQQFFAAIGVPVYQGYGLTEATPIISANTPARHKFGTSGMIIPGIACKIVDDKGNELPKGKQGEIIIKGDNVMKGYYLNQEATDSAIREEWLWTGDLGFIDKDDFLVVVGRQKALLISPNGEKYSPEGIEEAIVNSSEFIYQVMVYNDMCAYTVAVVTLNVEKIAKYIRTNAIASADDIISVIEKSFYKFLDNEVYKNQFPEIWIPSTFMIVAEPFTEQNLMINSTLKMVRHKVLDTYKLEIDRMYTPEANSPHNTYNQRTVYELFKLK
ncbi:MAG: AMP-binding protein, partial [Ignavibacteria bacterium]|nr:AMP-binding protein [Ignavibacteria bacterium]